MVVNDFTYDEEAGTGNYLVLLHDEKGDDETPTVGMWLLDELHCGDIVALSFLNLLWASLTMKV